MDDIDKRIVELSVELVKHQEQAQYGQLEKARDTLAVEKLAAEHWDEVEELRRRKAAIQEAYIRYIEQHDKVRNLTGLAGCYVALLLPEEIR